jgi:hypothetical protein
MFLWYFSVLLRCATGRHEREPADLRGAGAAAGGEVGQQGDGIALQQQQFQAAGAQRGLQGGERVVQPPALGAAMGMGAGGGIVQDIDRQDRAGGGGGVQGGVVGQAEILPEPQDGLGHRVCLTHDGLR